jgi:ribosome biogenesis protein BRX1
MNDLQLILPHSKRESKFDDKSALFQLNELAELNSCTHTLFLESRKPDDLYLWLAKCPSGPSVRFHVENIHTLDELAFAGNCMIGSRPLLSFDASLSQSEHGKIMQELLTSVFGTPLSCRKARPYYDHVFQFGVADGRIWFRNYQIIEGAENAQLQVNEMSLVEIGPRFVLNPVKLFAGSFGGSTIWSNDHFKSGAAIRAESRRATAGLHIQRVISHEAATTRKQQSQIERSELDKVFDN